MPDKSESVSGGFKMGHFPGVHDILARWAELHQPEPVPEVEFVRSTIPDAPMQMFLRFTTSAGPRTVVASGVPLKVASEIAQEMMAAGHYVEYIDDRSRPALAHLIKKQKSEGSAKPAASLKLAAACTAQKGAA
jgi:hypothetical protein